MGTTQPMKVPPIHIYCDASFSKKHQLAVAGFLLLEGENSPTDRDDIPRLQTLVFEENNKIRAELRGVIFAMERVIEQRSISKSGTLKGESQIFLYTDCQTIVSLPGRRKRLEASDFHGQRTRAPLRNAQLYKQFFLTSDLLNPTVLWVEGHRPKKDRAAINENFAHVDRAVRKELRTICRNSPALPV